MFHATTIRALPLIASMLGDKLGVKVNIGNTANACTDGNTIYLPALPVDADEKLYYLVSSFIDHESAHIRFTDFQILDNANMSPFEKHIWNAIEDWRIEHELVKRYPGCREHFDWLIRNVVQEESHEKAGNNPPAFSVLNYILLTLRSWDVPELKTGCAEEALVIEKHWPGLRGKIDAVLNQLPGNCHSTGDSIEYARKIVALLEEVDDSTPQSSQEQPDNSSSQEQTETSAQLLPAATQNARQENASSQAARESLDRLLNGTEEDLPQLFDEQLAEALNSTRKNTPYRGTRIAVEGQLEVHPLPENLRLESLTASRALRTRLQALMQARTLRRTAPGRYGRLDGRLLHRLSVQNPRVFLRREEVSGINTAVHILLDISASMHNNIRLATSACYAVASALSGIPGINVGVTAFPAHTPDDIPSVCPLVRHGQRVGIDFDVPAAGATPLAEAFWWIAGQMVPLKECRKILLLVTDGLPDNPEKVTEALLVLRQFGIKPVGIAICSSALADILPIQAEVNNLNELAGAMFGILQALLLHEKDNQHGK